MILYALALLTSAAGVGLLDARYRLAFGRAPWRTALLVGAGTAFFLIWDLIGIGEGVFRHADSRWATGILIAPQLPIEEVLFVCFLSYLTVVLHGGARLVLARRRGR